MVPEECEETHGRNSQLESAGDEKRKSSHSQRSSKMETSDVNELGAEKSSELEKSIAEVHEHEKSDEKESSTIKNDIKLVNSKTSSTRGSDLKSKSSHERSWNVKNNACSKDSTQNLAGIHRSSVGKSTRAESLAAKKEGERNIVNTSESTDFQSTNCNASLTMSETMESGASIEEHCYQSPAKLPNNINEGAQENHQPEKSISSDGREKSISAQTIDNCVTSKRNFDTYRTHTGEIGMNRTDLNRNDLSNIPVFEKSEFGNADSTNRNTNIESTVDNSMYLDNRNGTDWSKFDYSGSISNNNIDEMSDAVSVSQPRGLGSSPGGGGNQLMSKNHLYHEMCTEL